jgi:hypothetical protein
MGRILKAKSILLLMSKNLGIHRSPFASELWRRTSHSFEAIIPRSLIIYPLFPADCPTIDESSSSLPQTICKRESRKNIVKYHLANLLCEERWSLRLSMKLVGEKFYLK